MEIIIVSFGIRDIFKYRIYILVHVFAKEILKTHVSWEPEHLNRCDNNLPDSAIGEKHLIQGHALPCEVSTSSDSFLKLHPLPPMI
jgi:hypothetical protein